nr:restriction endonuclease subunit S [Roseomonas rosulenta]
MHWQEVPIKRAFDVTLGKMVVNFTEADVRTTRPYLRSANVQDGYLALDDTKEMWFSDEEAASLDLRAGDLVICEGGDVGRCAFLNVGLPGFGFQNSVNRARAKGKNSAHFLGFWLRKLKSDGYIDILCNRSTIAHFTAEKVAATPMFLPPPAEQSAIAVFLDRECGKIDALVAEQERLITLLKEKRQAVTSHAITKGLDPSALMKDSGVEWLGQVPAHWRVGRIGHYAVVENGSTPSRYNASFWSSDATVPWVSSGEVNQGLVTEPSEFITSDAMAAAGLHLIPAGSVLVGLVGQGRTRGMAALLMIDAAINQNVAAVIPRAELDGSFAYLALGAAYEFLRDYGRGGNQAALNCEILSSFRIPIPPLDEQARIVQIIREKTAQQSALIAEAEKAIVFLKERRAALISAAVTGKIDVRGCVAAEEAKAA